MENARHARGATALQRAAVDAIQDCWDIVRKPPPDPEETARASLAKGDYVSAEAALRPAMCAYTADGPRPHVQTLYLYLLEYHVFHWRNKHKSCAREEGLEKRIQRDFEDAYHLNDSAWAAISVLAFIQLKLGNHKKCDFLLFEAYKFVNDKPLPFIIQSMLYMQWVPPRPVRAEDFGFGFSLADVKPTGSRDVASAVKLLKHAIKLDKRVVAAHKCLALVQLQFLGDIEVGVRVFGWTMTHKLFVRIGTHVSLHLSLRCCCCCGANEECIDQCCTSLTVRGCLLTV